MKRDPEQQDETLPVGTLTPGEDDVDEIGEIVGLTYASDEQLRLGDKEHARDVHRWELDPASADDYQDRCGAKPSFAERLRHLGRR